MGNIRNLCQTAAPTFPARTSHHPNSIAQDQGASELAPASSELNNRRPRHSRLHSPKRGLMSAPSETMLSADRPRVLTELRNLPLVFAVDVLSRNKRVIQYTKKVICDITSKLEPDSLIKHSHISPWDSRAHDMTETFRTGLRTSFENPLACETIKEAKLWFLMTDGAVSEHRIDSFAHQITEKKLHGTPAVIIVFGNRSQPPSAGNFSIGMSVCAAAPHCVFLFHDIWSDELFILQAKGCFASLLPKGSYFKWFGGTRWSDIPQTTYGNLLRVKIPDPIRLSEDQIALPYGQLFDMKSIYDDSVSEDVKSQLVSNDPALDAILVVSKSRREGYLVKLWVEHLRRTTVRENEALLEREDVDSRGKQAMKRLLLAAEHEVEANYNHHEDIWDCLVSDASGRLRYGFGPVFSNLDALREALCLLNKQNWYNFEAKMVMRQNASRHVTDSLQEVQSAVGILDDLLPDEHRASLPGTFWYPTSGLKASTGTEMSSHTEPSDLNNEGLNMSLFLPGFKGKRKLQKDELSNAYTTCAICREPKSIQTLLLQTSPKDNETPGLPLADQRKDMEHPLALGDCPEMDIILPITCCDGCAFLLLKVDKLPSGHHIAAALPLISLQRKENRRMWRHTLAKVYRNRFHEDTVSFAFLASVCTKIENLEQPSNLRQCLEWCRNELSKIPGIHLSFHASPKLVTSLPSAVDNKVPPQQVVFFACLGNKFHLRVVLAQPLEAFIVFVQIATSMNIIKPAAIQNLVWNRLLCHFVKQQMRLRLNFGLEYANEMLREIIYRTDQDRCGESATEPPKRKRTSIPLTLLINTYLIPRNSRIVSHFFRTGYFGDIYSTEKYNAALAVFFHMLANMSYREECREEGLMDVLEDVQHIASKLWQVVEDVRNVFEDPTLVDEPGAAYLIANLESWLKYVMSSS